MRTYLLGCLMAAALLTTSCSAASARPAPEPTAGDLVTFVDVANDRAVATMATELAVHVDESVATCYAVVDTQRLATFHLSAQRPAAPVATVAPRSQATHFSTYHSKELKYRSRWHKLHGKWYKFYYIRGARRPVNADNLHIDPGRRNSQNG